MSQRAERAAWLCRPVPGALGSVWGHTGGVPSPATYPLYPPQRLVVEQAARGSSPPDLRLQYLHQMQANHEVRPFRGPCPEPSTRQGSTGVTHTSTCMSPSLVEPPSPLSPQSGLGSRCRGEMRAEWARSRYPTLARTFWSPGDGVSPQLSHASCPEGSSC